MARVLCSAWDGGGNVNVHLALGARLVERGHDVRMLGSASMVERCEHAGIRATAGDMWGSGLPDQLASAAREADVLLPDLLLPRDALAAAEASGLPVGVVVHTLWSFVPAFDGADGMMGAGFLDQLDRFDRLLVFTARELDTGDVPDNARYVGPAIEPEGPDAGWVPPPRSLVVVSLGTTDLGEGPVLQRVLDALADAPVDVIATVAPHVDRSALRVPANARVTGLIRHAALLPHADVFVGHAGHGGIMSALAFGVPIVCIPLDRDQPHNAARVEAVGAGRTVSKDADPGAIRDVVQAVRTGESYRVAAVRMANAIAGYGDRAVDEVEALLR